MNLVRFFYISLFLPISIFAQNDNFVNDSLQRRGLTYYPATVDAKTSNTTFQKLPTGAKDFDVILPSPKNDIVVNASDFGLNQSITNSATIINKAIEYCKKIKAGKLVIDKGTYKCFDAVPIINNLLFENNKFFDTQGLVAVISSSDNVIFRNNVIENEFDYGNNLWYRGGFYVRNSKNIYIVDNAFVESSKVPLAGVYSQQKTVENLVVSGNKIISKK